MKDSTVSARVENIIKTEAEGEHPKVCVNLQTDVR